MQLVNAVLLFNFCLLWQVLDVKSSTCGKLKNKIKSYEDEVERQKISLEEYQLVTGQTEDVSDECSESDNCSNCLWEKWNDGCGWCVLQNRCSLRKICPAGDSASNSWISGSDKCPKIRAVIPHNIQATTSNKLQIIIPHLPDYNGTFICSFEVPGKTLVTRGEKFDRGITCPSPYSDKLPKIANGKDDMTVKLSVRIPNGRNFVSTSNFTIYDCGRYQTCSECSASTYPCSWCIERQKCTHNVSENCRNDIIVFSKSVTRPTTRQGPGYCPRISSDESENEILVPSGSKKRISVKVENIMASQVAGRFTCKVKGLPEVTGQLLGDTVYCDDINLRMLGRQPFYNLTLSVFLNGEGQLDNPQNVQVVVYNCERMADSCGECTDLPSRYGCGWCEELDSCSFNDSCLNSPWVNSNGTCKKPEIRSIHPSVGLLTVKTNLTIEGVNLAKEFKDIDNVTLITEGGETFVDCAPYESLYVRHSRIVCLLDTPKNVFRNNSTLSGIVEVKLAKDFVAISEQRYSFVDPVIDGFRPNEGMVSGGTYLTIIGHYLDAGNEVKVYIGDLPCQVKSRDRSSIQCISSPTPFTKPAPKSVPVRVLFDGEERTSSSHFFYVADPSVLSVRGEHGAPSPIGTPSGGNLIIVEGNNLNRAPSAYIYVIVDGDEYPGACSVISETRMECLSPKIPAEILNFCEDEGPLSFHYGFRMGDAEGVQNISHCADFEMFKLYPDPYLMPFNDERRIKNFKSDYLVIHGRYLNNVYNEKDYSVKVDGVDCRVTSLSLTQLTCRLTDQQVDDYDENRLLEVQVRIRASVKYFVGYLRRVRD